MCCLEKAGRAFCYPEISPAPLLRHFQELALRMLPLSPTPLLLSSQELALRMARLLGLKASIQGSDSKRHVVVAATTRSAREEPGEDTIHQVRRGRGGGTP